MPMPVRVSAALDVAIGSSRVTLTPRQGLILAEVLTRRSFAKAIVEESAREGIDLRAAGKLPASPPRRGPRT